MTQGVCYIGAGSRDTRRMQGSRLVPCEPDLARSLAVIVDVADETQVVSSMPLVRGGGNAALLRQRRLEREFPGVALKTSLPYRNRPGDGLADIVLMSTDSTGSLAAELARLGQDKAVRGIYTPAMLAAHWMKRAGLQDRKVLIAMPTPAGLRLMFIDQCCPLLSRLVPQMTPESLATELGRTIQYLHNSQRLSRDTRLELWFWGMDEAVISASLPTADNFELTAAPRIPRLPDPEAEGFDALLHLAAVDPPRHQLAPHDMRAEWYLQRIHRWSLASAAAILLCGACSTWWLLSGTRAIRSEVNNVLANDAAYHDQRTQIEERLATTGLGVEELLSLPLVARSLATSQVEPAEALHLAATVLGARNEIMIQSVEFQSGSLGLEATATSGGCTNEVVAGAPVFEATFRLADGLAVREGALALAHVRKAVTTAGSWRSTPSSSAIGELQPVSVKSTSDDSVSDGQWLTCLWRETLS